MPIDRRGGSGRYRVHGVHAWPDGEPVVRGQRVAGPGGFGRIEAISCRGFYVRSEADIGGRSRWVRYGWARLGEFTRNRGGRGDP